MKRAALSASFIAMVIACTVPARGTAPSRTYVVRVGDKTFTSYGLAAGDVNGDGYGDFLILSPTYTHGELLEGGAFLYLGSVAGVAVTPAWAAEGQRERAEYGATATAGDIDGDGYGDVIIGAPRYRFSDGKLGLVFIYNGSASGLRTHSTFRFPREGNWNPAESVSAGDVNGDGLLDLLLGGRLFLGTPAGPSLTPVRSFVPEVEQHLVTRVLGDVNGDRFDDVAVYPFVEVSGPQLASLYGGEAAGLPATPTWVLEKGSAYPDHLFYSLYPLGDLNGDGRDDVSISGSEVDSFHPRSDGPHLLLGSAQGLPAAPDQKDIPRGAPAGDVDGDGFGDLVAWDFEDGLPTLHVHRGTAHGIEPRAAWISEEPIQYMGGAGDLDGDGLAEIWGTSSESDPDPNRLYVYSHLCHEVIVDSGGPGTGFTGTWSLSGASGQYGPDSRWAHGTTSSAPTYSFVASLEPGTYGVFEWHSVLASRTRSATHLIEHAAGAAAVPVDQSVKGGQWNLLGVYNFNGASSVTIRADDRVSSTNADAIRFVCKLPELPRAIIDSVPETVIKGDPICVSGHGESRVPIEAYEWLYDADPFSRRSQASFCDTVSSTSRLEANERHEVTFRVRDAFGVWSEPVGFSFFVKPCADYTLDDADSSSTSSTGSWRLSAAPAAFGSGSRWAKPSSPASFASFTFEQSTRFGQWEVFEWHSRYAGRTRSARHVIEHIEGTTEVIVDQSVGGGQWNSLGTYWFDSRARVTIFAEDTSRSTNADAIWLGCRDG